MTEREARAVRLTGEITTLREFTPADVDSVAAIIGDDRVTAYLSFDSRTREQASAMISGVIERAGEQPRTEYYLAATTRDDDDVIGFVRLALGAHQAAKIGYAIAWDQQGHGYATDAVATILDFGFAQLDLHRVTAAIGPDNPPSHTLVQRLGFHREAVLRDHVFTNNAWRDSVLYSILVDEWRKVRRS